MLYVLLFIALIFGGLILKLAAGVIRILLIIVLTLVLIGVFAATGDDEAVAPAPAATETR